VTVTVTVTYKCNNYYYSLRVWKL